jgi:ubiquinone/menaquinone biosynthesis C-methylase UbiE
VTDQQPDSQKADDYGQTFDARAAGEWGRFDKQLSGRVSLELHKQFLAEYVRRGDRVLDAGAGPGRFTIELAQLGARVVVGDVSPVMLDLNTEKVAEAGLEDHVESRELLDIVDLSRFPDESFDAVVCFGGPLSYVRERAPAAARELSRVTQPGGYLLASVMSKIGVHRIWLEDILGRIADEHSVEATDQVFRTGELTGELNDGHAMHLYTDAELRELLERSGCEVLASAAANFITARRSDLELNEVRQAVLVEWDLLASREPGAVDGGTHIIAVARRI